MDLFTAKYVRVHADFCFNSWLGTYYYYYTVHLHLSPSNTKIISNALDAYSNGTGIFLKARLNEVMETEFRTL